ncbi:MAG: class I SAM-dependent methyltransferase [Actinomycetota bacterium]
MTKALDEVSHPLFARMYSRMSEKAEAKGVSEHRKELLAGLSGQVIEVGCGNGLNFVHYPATVEEVLAVEPEPHLRELALEASGSAPVKVSVVPGVADALPAESASFDAGVASLVLCTVPDQRRALAELFRVIRPGGELRFYEHVRATTPVLGPLLRFAQATFWPRIAGGCHPARDTEKAVADSGFRIEKIREFRFSPSPPMPAVPHIIGAARRP